MNVNKKLLVDVAVMNKKSSKTYSRDRYIPDDIMTDLEIYHKEIEIDLPAILNLRTIQEYLPNFKIVSWSVIETYDTKLTVINEKKYK